MNRLILAVLMILPILGEMGYSQGVAPKVRWQLEFEMLGKKKPDMFTYTDPRNEVKEYWYIYFSLTNNSVINLNENVPSVYMDFMLHTEHSQMLDADVRKMNPAYTKRRGAYYFCTIPDEKVEYEIIKKLSNGHRLNEGVFEERVDEWKKRGKYLNVSEIRQLGHLKPGQTITGIAIFHDVDPEFRRFDFRVTGYKSFLKITGFKKGMQQELEPEVKIYKYMFKGDSFDRFKDVVVPYSSLPLIVKKKIGPIGSKETLHFLIGMMVDGVKQEEELKENPPQDVQNSDGEGKGRDTSAITPQDMWIAGMFMSFAIEGMENDNRYVYDPSRSILENRKVVWRWDEWWTRNAHRIQYDDNKAKFVLSHEVIPGAKKPDTDEGEGS